MKIHEYQSKSLFSDFEIPTLKNRVAKSASDAVEYAKSLSSEGPWVVKAQVHAGGRGKAGGVKVCKTLDEVKDLSKTLLSKPLVTHQTGPEGAPVSCILIEEPCNIDHEFYLAAVMDRETSSIILMASREGGVEIEEVADNTPEKIIKIHVNPQDGFMAYHARSLAFGLELSKDQAKQVNHIAKKLIDIFVEKDCALVEVNPLVLSKEGQFIALDGKVDFDGNALYRHEDIVAFRDISQENAKDVEAQKWGLNYINLDGNIACMVNGAGLAMATMDMIKMAGGEPANFLDVGGGASTEMVREAFKILVSDDNVKGIFVNIFGGIMRCDVLAQGIVDAVSQVGLELPLIVRLEGTNVEKGREILNNSGLNIQTSTNIREAAELAVSSVKA